MGLFADVDKYRYNQQRLMEIRNFINAARNALLVLSFLFLPVSSVQAATNDQTTTFTFRPSIEGLRFETPIRSTLTIDFITELQTSKEEQPLIISTKQDQNASLLDILIPNVLAEEASPSAEVEALEATESAEILDVLEEATAPTKNTRATLIKKVAVVTPKPVLTPTSSPTPTPTATPISTPVATPVPAQGGLSNGGLNANKVFDLVNNYRATKGLAALQKDERACEVARSRAPEIAAEISGGYMHKGIKERNLPYWNSENIITMRTEEAAVNWWINDYIHRVQMEGDYQFSCVACHGNACVQEFTNFQPKR
jgi:uncharacterized protein YkwD